VDGIVESGAVDLHGSDEDAEKARLHRLRDAIGSEQDGDGYQVRSVLPDVGEAVNEDQQLTLFGPDLLGD
jgi:hypothetical protein